RVVVDLDDARMRELRQQVELALEQRAQRVPVLRARARQTLEGERATGRLIARRVHDCDAAAPQLALDHIALTDARGGCLGTARVPLSLRAHPGQLRVELRSRRSFRRGGTSDRPTRWFTHNLNNPSD